MLHAEEENCRAKKLTKLSLAAGFNFLVVKVSL
jgi:hypothetical protein